MCPVMAFTGNVTTSQQVLDVYGKVLAQGWQEEILCRQQAADTKKVLGRLKLSDMKNVYRPFLFIRLSCDLCFIIHLGSMRNFILLNQCQSSSLDRTGWATEKEDLRPAGQTSMLADI